MNAILSTHFARVDAALTTLLDSIASYNPSPSAAGALIEADDLLSQGLEQLSTHQANHVRLTSLHQTAAELSAQLTETLTQLASTRQDLLSTPATVFAVQPVRHVNADELLAYAKRISKFTVPPTRRLAAATPTEAGSPVGDCEKGKAVEALQPHESQWVNPAKPPWFIPWPADETIRRGGLAMLQAGVGKETGGAAGESKEDEEEGASAQDVKVTAAAAPAQRREEKKKPAVFSGLDLYDPDDD